jgi:type VI secretion system secreted protein Hcp
MKNIQKVALASLVAGTATAAGDASAAFDTFIKFDGITGESTMKGEEGAIKLASFEFSATATADATTGLASGKRQFSPIVIQKPVDQASISLFKSFLTGEAVRTAEIDFVTTTPHAGATPYLKIDLAEVTISSFSISSGGDRPTESISFNFHKIETSYVGKVVGVTNPGTPTTAGWDLTTIKAE